jgi:glycosyltransferase involved in cell wall biosynthesis
MKKRIALNGRFTGSKQPTGTQKVAFHLFDQILRRNRDFEFVVFADSLFPGVKAWEKLPNTLFVETPLQDWSTAHGHLWEQLQLPRYCHHYGCTFAHHPTTTSPAKKGNCKSLVTLHDLNYYSHPKWYSASFRAAYGYCATRGLKQADKVVAVSNYVFNQARELLRIPEERLGMVYNGVAPLPPASFSIKTSAPYLLCVGALPTHKNLARLIRAFQIVRKEFDGLELHLVGQPPQRLIKKIPRLSRLMNSPGVVKLGYLSDTELASAYAGAALYCYPSLEEGFGLPVLEALSIGTPVVTSNTSSLPEIAGPCAVLVDPYSVEAIAEGLRQALHFTPEVRSFLARQGREWATRFSWAATTDAYFQIYSELI